MSSTFDIARRTLWKGTDLDDSVLHRTLCLAASGGVDWADLYFQHIESHDWILEDGIVKTGHFSIDRGFGLRTIVGERQALSYGDDMHADALTTAARRVRTLEGHRTHAVPVAMARRSLTPLYRADIETPDALEEIELLRHIDQYLRARSPFVKNVMATLQSEKETVLIATLDGELTADIRPQLYLSISVLVEKAGKSEQGMSGGGARTGFGFLTRERVETWCNRALAEALQNVEAQPAPSGVMPVVLGPGWPGILLHEAVGHGLEADAHRKETSIFTGKLGTRVAPAGVTIVDDGSLPERRGSLSVDDEGTPTARTVLIEDGILTGLLTDRLNATLLGVPLTGNGRRESFATLPLPRMTNTFMLSGEYAPEEIIASVKNGLYAAHFAGGQVDITSGDFVFTMSGARRIRNGRLAEPVKGATLIGRGDKALLGIRLVGNDSILDDGIGQCGKDGQNCPVGVGLPTLRIDSLTVGGTSA